VPYGILVAIKINQITSYLIVSVNELFQQANEKSNKANMHGSLWIVHMRRIAMRPTTSFETGLVAAID
jgi:hypothetical protein